MHSAGVGTVHVSGPGFDVGSVGLLRWCERGRGAAAVVIRSLVKPVSPPLSSLLLRVHALVFSETTLRPHSKHYFICEHKHHLTTGAELVHSLSL